MAKLAVLRSKGIPLGQLQSDRHVADSFPRGCRATSEKSTACIFTVTTSYQNADPAMCSGPLT
jgi:hypothetical protein